MASSGAGITSPDDPATEAAPFGGLSRAQLLQPARVEAEIRGERQHDFKNVGQFLRNVRVVCRGRLAGFLDKFRPEKFPVLTNASDPDNRLATLSADDLRNLVADQLFLSHVRRQRTG
jgi:hypothetical protein